MKLMITVGVALLMSVSTWAEAKNKKLRKLAQVVSSQDGYVELSYSSTGVENFTDVKINITPYAKFISFKSFEGKTYIMDCEINDEYTKWNCNSPCEGGDMIVNFSNSLYFKRIAIEPTVLIPRLCDGSESAEDPKLRISKKTILKLEE